MVKNFDCLRTSGVARVLSCYNSTFPADLSHVTSTNLCMWVVPVAFPNCISILQCHTHARTTSNVSHTSFVLARVFGFYKRHASTWHNVRSQLETKVMTFSIRMKTVQVTYEMTSRRIADYYSVDLPACLQSCDARQRMQKWATSVFMRLMLAVFCKRLVRSIRHDDIITNPPPATSS